MRGFDFLTDPVDGGTFVLLIVLYCLGARLVQANEKLQSLGKRIALVSFFLFVALLAYEWKPAAADEWAMILLRSLVFAGIVLGAAWTVLPVLSFAYDYTFGALFRTLDNWSRAARRRAEERKTERDRRRRDAEWERDRPRRERDAHEAALQAEAETRIKRTAQKRREDARAECDALFSFAAPAITTRFSKQDFTEFVSKYMTDAAPPEVVEERGEQLKGIIRHHWERIEPPRQSLKELSEWFEKRMSELQSVPDEKLRKTLIVQLKGRYSDLTSTMLSEMSP